MTIRSTSLIASIFGLFLVVGCRSTVSSDGTVGDRTPSISGTAFAWIDSTQYEVDDDKIVLRDRGTDETTLRLIMSGAYFDPAVDFNSLTVEQRFQISDDLAKNDSLSLTIFRGNRIDAGDNLDFDSDDFDIPDSKPYIASASFQFGNEPINRDSEYPDEVDVLGTGRKVDLEISTFDEESRIGGTMTFELFEADGDDRKNVVEGSFSVTFDVEILKERIAECNFGGGAGAVNACDDLDLAE